LCNPELFPDSDYKPNELLEKYYDYHLRAIATSKGVALLEQYNTEKKL
jgi:hypothetical protein